MDYYWDELSRAVATMRREAVRLARGPLRVSWRDRAHRHAAAPEAVGSDEVRERR